MKFLQTILIAFLLVNVAYSQQEYIFLGGVQISLGMSKAELLEKIDNMNFKITIDKVLIIESRTAKNEYLGAVFFNNERVSGIEKNWSMLSDNIIDDLKNLYAIFEQEKKEGREMYVIGPYYYVDPGVE